MEMGVVMASCIRPINVAIATRNPSDIALSAMMLAFDGNYRHVHIRRVPIAEQYRIYTCFTDVVMAALCSAQRARRECAADLGLSIQRERISLLSVDRKSRRNFEIIVCVSAADVGPVALHVPTDVLPDDLYDRFNAEAREIITQWCEGDSPVPPEIQAIELGIQNALDRSLFTQGIEQNEIM